MSCIKDDHFRFGFLLKNNQTKFFYLKKSKPNQNWLKPTGFQFNFYDKNRFKPVWLGFSDLA
jgi:hypothetical protein